MLKMKRFYALYAFSRFPLKTRKHPGIEDRGMAALASQCCLEMGPLPGVTAQFEIGFPLKMRIV